MENWIPETSRPGDSVRRWRSWRRDRITARSTLRWSARLPAEGRNEGDVREPDSGRLRRASGQCGTRREAPARACAVRGDSGRDLHRRCRTGRPSPGATRPCDREACEGELMAQPASVRQEILSGVRTLASASAYALLIVTFAFQVARVDGRSMEPTLNDHDRLIISGLTYRWGDPRPGDIVMLYYPRNP